MKAFRPVRNVGEYGVDIPIYYKRRACTDRQKSSIWRYNNGNFSKIEGRYIKNNSAFQVLSMIYKNKTHLETSNESMEHYEWKKIIYKRKITDYL